MLVVFNERGHVLTLTRGFDSRNLALPGGHQGATDTSAEQTAARVLVDETGLYPAPDSPREAPFSVWPGEHGQPVYAFHISQTQGKLRASHKGKPLWARPKLLFAKSCQFHEKARELLVPLIEAAANAAGEEESAT